MLKPHSVKTLSAMLSALVMTTFTAAAQADGQWCQFGGPNQDFVASCNGLAKSWPKDGPKKLWRRDLGDGYSMISVDGDRLYTMYSVGDGDDHVEHVIALEAATGKTIWDTPYKAAFLPGMGMEFGNGPHSTPLVDQDNVYTIGVTCLMKCWDKATGKEKWAHDLRTEFNAGGLGRGYACSPIAYKDHVIVMASGDDQTVVALNRKDGSVAWKSLSGNNVAATPILIKFDGKDQLVVLSAAELAGLNPDNGEVLWKHPHAGTNLSSPLWIPERDTIFVSSAYNLGSRAIKLKKGAEGKTETEELWFNSKIQVHFSNYVTVGDYVYASSGDFGPAFFTAIDLKDGSMAWRHRGLRKASMVLADGRLYLIDEDGGLSMVTPSGSEFKLDAQVPLLAKNAWTAPTIVGKNLYARDRKEIMALDLTTGA